MEAPQQCRFIVVDADPLTRFGIFSTAILFPHLNCCGEAGDARGARQLCAEERPNLIILDFTIPQGSVSLIRELAALHPPVRLLIVSACENPLFIQRAYRAGALGYVIKREEAAATFIAIEAVLRGVRHRSPRVAQILLDASDLSKARSALARVSVLSDCELSVFERMGRKQGTTVIAREMGLSIKTIETHQRRIRDKLNLATMVALRDTAWRWVKKCATANSVARKHRGS